MSYSLPREDYFRHIQVDATGDLGPASFYGASAYILILLLCAVPVSGYLLPYRPVLERKLGMAGMGPLTQVLARTGGLGVLMMAATGQIVLVMAAGMAAPGELGDIFFSLKAGIGDSFSKAGVWDSLTDKLLLAVTVTAVCFAVAAVVVLVYRLAGSLLGGIMLLFLLATVQHFLAGGFLPLVFLPASVKGLAQVLPSGILMDAVGMALTAHWDGMVFGRLGLLAAGAVGTAALWQAGGERR